MKFSDGYWRMRKGVRGYYAAQAYEIEATADELVVFAPVRRVEQRGDTLDQAQVSLRFWSPAPDVIGVQVRHWAGAQARGPHFDLNITHRDVQVAVDEESASLASGNLAVQVNRKGALKVEFVGRGQRLTAAGGHGFGYVEVDEPANAPQEDPGPDGPPGHYIVCQLALGVGEQVYGLGERFTPFVRNGQVVNLWNADGGTASELAYKNIPFYLTNRGYGVFVNDSGPVSLEAGSEIVSQIQFSVPGQVVEYFVIYGPSPKEVLENYTALTGRPALPPAWTFGLWLTTSFTTNYDEASVSAVLEGMRSRSLPLHIFHFDCFWMKEFHWSDFLWDERTFPDPAGMLARLKAGGLHICVWINPYIAQRSAVFEQANQAGYLLKRPNGDAWQTDTWQAGMGIVDFTNPSARTWFGEQLKRLLAMGVDCFKTDFGERIPTQVVYFNQADPVRMHNYFTYLYNQTVFETLQETIGEAEAVVFARSATAGSQKYPVHWGGDSESTFESMAASLRGGLSLGLAGFGFWSHDIGGFDGTPPPEVYKRWVAFGLLSSHSRLHGSNSYRVPWLVDEESVEVLRKFTQLKCRLMPYLYAKAVEAHQSGVPLLRAMFVEFPGDPGCASLDRQYMLGDSLLVAPVFTPTGDVEYYLPAGRWTDFFSGRIIEGGRWVKETHGFLSLPLLVRPGTLLAVGNREDRPDYDFTQGVTLRLYDAGANLKAWCDIPDLGGRTAARCEATLNEDEIRLSVEGRLENAKLLLLGKHKAEFDCAGECSDTPEGVLVAIPNGAQDMVIRRRS